MSRYTDGVEAVVKWYEDNPEDRARALLRHQRGEDGLCTSCRIHERPEYRPFASCLVAYTAAKADDRVAVKRQASRTVIVSGHPDATFLPAPEERPKEQSWSPTSLPNGETDTSAAS